MYKAFPLLRNEVSRLSSTELTTPAGVNSSHPSSRKAIPRITKTISYAERSSGNSSTTVQVYPFWVIVCCKPYSHPTRSGLAPFSGLGNSDEPECFHKSTFFALQGRMKKNRKINTAPAIRFNLAKRLNKKGCPSIRQPSDSPCSPCNYGAQSQLVYFLDRRAMTRIITARGSTARIREMIPIREGVIIRICRSLEGRYRPSLS